MQLPKLRLPSFGGGGRVVVLYSLWTFVLFLIFLVATFPHDLLLRSALEKIGFGPGNSQIAFNDVKFAWLRGYQIDGLRIPPTPGNDTSYLELTHLWVRPTLGKLVRGNPYSVTLNAELYGGSAGGEIEYVNGSLKGDIAWDGLNLASYRPLVTLLEEGTLVGRVSGLLSFDAPLRTPASSQAAGDLALDGAMITGGKVPGFTFGDIGLKQAKLKFKTGPGRIEVQDLTMNGDVSVQQTSGQIGLRDPINESTLNLRTNILQTATTPDWLKTLIAAIPRAPGAKLDSPVNVTGTLAKPRFR